MSERKWYYYYSVFWIGLLLGMVLFSLLSGFLGVIVLKALVQTLFHVIGIIIMCLFMMLAVSVGTWGK